MKKENTVGFRVKVYDAIPREVYAELKPENFISEQWIPQTLGDQVWIWFEFKDQADKDAYIKTVSEKYRDMFMHDEEIFTQEFIDYWTR